MDTKLYLLLGQERYSADNVATHSKERLITLNSLQSFMKSGILDVIAVLGWDYFSLMPAIRSNHCLTHPI